MGDLKEQQKRRKKLRARKEWPRKKFKLVVVVCVLLFFTIALGNQHYKDISMSRKVRNAMAAQNLKEIRKKELEEEKLKLHDPEYLKKLARKDLYMMDDNEIHIQITKEEEDKKDKP